MLIKIILLKVDNLDDKNNGAKDAKLVLYGIISLIAIVFFAYQIVSFLITESHKTETVDKNKQLEQFYQYEIDKQNNSNNN